MWYVETQKSERMDNNGVIEWWVHDYEGAAYLTESCKEAEALSNFLNSINLNGRSGNFGQICEELLKLYRKQTAPIELENTQEETAITVGAFLDKLEQLKPNMNDLILIRHHNGSYSITDIQLNYVLLNHSQSYLGIESFSTTEGITNQKAIVIQ